MSRNMLDRASELDSLADNLHRATYPVIHTIKSDKKLKKYKKPKVFIASSAAELDKRIQVYERSLGNAGKGNKRRGQKSYFYAELVQYFCDCRAKDERLPGSHLSRKQLTPELFRILEEHGYIPEGTTYESLVKNSIRRVKLFHKVERIFKRVIQLI